MESDTTRAKEGRSGNLRSYWTTTKLCELSVVLDYYEAMGTYSRIGLIRVYGNFSLVGLLRGYGYLRSYWTNTRL
jgi:hypothetical protein